MTNYFFMNFLIYTQNIEYQQFKIISLLKRNILRVHLPKGTANVEEDCDIMIDQVRAIDNKRLIRKIGILPDKQSLQVMSNLSIVLDLPNP